MMNKLSHSTATIVLLREWGSGRVGIDKYGSPVVDYDLENRDKRNLTMGMNEAARILAAAGASEIWTLHSDPVYLRAENGGVSDEKLDTFFETVGRRGVQPNRMFMGSAHIMGSCRMSADESKGAVSPHGELYGVENLFIGDASVFPTAPGVNPMVTIMAMSMRTAEFMKAKLRRSS
jgi:long-chain-alcohol oxidase